MAKKKKTTTPLPNSTAGLQIVTADSVLSKSSLQSHSTIEENDELVTPGAHIVHPSAGAIPRRDVQIIEASHRSFFQGLGEKSNGTVLVGDSVSRSGQNPGPVGSQTPPGTDSNTSPEWSGLFKGKLNASERRSKYMRRV